MFVAMEPTIFSCMN